MKIATKNLKCNFNKFSSKFFRSWRMNDHVFADNRHYGGHVPSPYQPQFSLTEDEKVANEKLPITERILDFSKYMKHKGELKYSTGIFMQDVEPFPRLKVMMLCHIILDLAKELDNSFLYKQVLKEMIKFIMDVVDENDTLVHIETALIKFNNLEELILKLHDEVTLLRTILRNDQYKESMKDDEDDHDPAFFFPLAFGEFSVHDAAENSTHRRHDKKERPATYNENI